MNQIRLLDAAIRDLAKLAKPVAQRIVRRLRWPGENFEDINPEPLKGDLSAFYKLRVGDYRILYDIQHTSQEIVIHAVGHRRDIYRRKE
jgi:mRNA interferase RelE/StbE